MEHWIDIADSYICPICGFETDNPSRYESARCPKCGFQDAKDSVKRSDNMTSENDILIAMQESVRKALSEAANEEIEKLMHRFECKMGEIKRDMIGKILNNIDIVTSHDPACEGYIVQVNIKK